MDNLFTASDLFKGIAVLLLSLMLFVWKKLESRIKGIEDHDRLQDDALHKINLDLVEHRGTVADLKNIESRIMRIEIIIARIDERMAGRRREHRQDDEN